MQVLVIGAGVIGLAVARGAACKGHEVIVAEAAGNIGTGISSRNSEVIHGGMYYATGTLRGRHCVRGRRMLYEFCAAHGVPHRKCGKLVGGNKDAGLERLGGNPARALEPELSCVGALHSAETGIIDGHAYMLALRGDLEDRGGAIAFNTPVTGATRKNRQWLVSFGGREAGQFAFDAIANCAGLGAQSVARSIPDYAETQVRRLLLAKGNYFTFTGKMPFKRLIYPTPIVGGLGVPARPQGGLSPDYPGIRPKLSGPNEPQGDFLIDTPARHGLPGLVQMFGIESPGLTASLSRDVWDW